MRIPYIEVTRARGKRHFVYANLLICVLGYIKIIVNQTIQTFINCNVATMFSPKEKRFPVKLVQGF